MCGTRLLCETKTVEMCDVDEKERGRGGREGGQALWKGGQQQSRARVARKLWRQGKQQPVWAVTTETIVLTKKYPTDQTLMEP